MWSCVDIILQNPFYSFQFYSVFSVMVEKHNLCDGIIRFPLTCNIWSMLCISCTWHILNNISLHASYYEAKEKNAITYDLLEAASWQSSRGDNLRCSMAQCSE